MTLDINTPHLPDSVDQGPSEPTLRQIYVDEVATARRRVRMNLGIASVFLGGPIGVLIASRVTGDAPPPAMFFYLMGPGVAAVRTAIEARRELAETIASTPENLQARRAEREAAARARIERQSAIRSERRPVLTGVLMAIVALVGVVQAWRGVGSLAAVSLAPSILTNHEWWRLGTAWFANVSGFHFGGALLFLLVAGPLFEILAPRWRLPLVFLVAGVTGSLASVAAHDVPRALGAGASLAGIWTYETLRFYRRPADVLGSRAANAYLLMIPLLVLAVYTQLAGDQVYHLAGAIAGGIIAWITVPRGDGAELESSRVMDRMGRVSLAIILALAVFAGVKMWTSPVVLQPIALVGATVLDSTGRAHNGVTVVIDGSTMSTVEPGLTEVPGARVIGIGANVVVAVTLDKREPAILKSLRHAWVGQVFIGAPSDVFVLDGASMRRGRGQVTDVRTQDINERNVVAAVVDGKYYSRAQLLAQLK